MRLVRFLTTLETARDFESLHDEPTPLFACSNADTAIVLASLRDHLSREVGVWLRVSGEYPAQIATRDVRTLSVLMDLRHVVIDAPEPVSEQVEIVRALLSGDEVSLTNSVATLTHVVSRPVPPRPITVWGFDGGQLVSPEVTLAAGATAPPGSKRVDLLRGLLGLTRDPIGTDLDRHAHFAWRAPRVGVEPGVLLREVVDDLVGALGGKDHDGAAHRDAGLGIVGIDQRNGHARVGWRGCEPSRGPGRY